MSSMYRFICLSHDPALIVHDGFQRRDDAIGAVENLAAFHDLAEHADCDLLIGRYSYPLIELCCFARDGLTRHPRLSHSNHQWVDVEWLRLLYAALKADPASALAKAVEPLTDRCWSWDRLYRLRFELGVEESGGAT